MHYLHPDISVNGEGISRTDIAAEAQNHNAPAGKPGQASNAAAKALVVRTLLLQEASRLELTPAPQEIGGDKWETDDEALIRAVLDLELENEPISSDTCRVIYDRKPEVFRSPSLYQPAHILFAARPEDKDAREVAKLNALTALEKVQSNPKAFAKVAKANSDCPSKENGGELGQLASGDTVPEFETVLEELEAGQLHPTPVETRYGFHIVRMDEKVTGQILPFENVEPQIHEKLLQFAWAKAARDLTARLVEAAEIVGIDMSKDVSEAA